MKTNLLMMAVGVLTLAACSDGRKDYEASAECQNLGEKPGTTEYDRCMRDQKQIKMMEQQRREYEEMKQQQQDWNLRRY